ncbi:PspC domain-containing protein [Virgibacillus flavescens]|uniref:PspC domain-containing protein n=1 Tax=Virgibacillus flavescens TaxID=1611422 RepID=UPI003D333203
MKRLTRSKSNKMISGVLGGLANYFEIDATIVRLAFVVLTFMSVFTLVIIYFAAAMIIPSEQEID